MAALALVDELLALGGTRRDVLVVEALGQGQDAGGTQAPGSRGTGELGTVAAVRAGGRFLGLARLGSGNPLVGLLLGCLGALLCRLSLLLGRPGLVVGLGDPLLGVALGLLDARGECGHVRVGVLLGGRVVGGPLVEGGPEAVVLTALGVVVAAEAVELAGDVGVLVGQRGEPALDVLVGRAEVGVLGLELSVLALELGDALLVLGSELLQLGVARLHLGQGRA